MVKNITDLHHDAEAGNATAQAILGIYYLEGIEVETDYTKEFKFLSAAVDKNVARAATSLARMYAEGLGTEKNPHKAIRFYQIAAEAGEFMAQI